MDDSFSTPPPSRQKSMSRYEWTPTAYEQRCAGIPTPDDPEYVAATQADFTAYSMAGNASVVTEWLVQYFSKRKQIVIGPYVMVVDDGNESSPFTLRMNHSLFKEFAVEVCKRKRMGLFMCSLHSPTNAHSVLCVWDAQHDEKRTNVYFIDPDGFHKTTQRYVRACRHFFTKYVLEWMYMHRHVSASYRIHTFTLNTPNVNSNYTSHMRKRDKELGLSNSLLFEGGFCQYWTYVYLMDIMCTKKLFFSRGHFHRLYERAGGTSPSRQERDYTRLMFLRHVLTWITDRMFDPSDAIHAFTIKHWIDGVPYNPMAAQRKSWVPERSRFV